jgi:hypothetical protein
MLLSVVLFLVQAWLWPADAGVGDINLTGQWQGVYTQDRAGKRTDFRCEVIIEQKANKITGRSFVFDEDIHAEMAFEGVVLKGQLVHCEESAILRQEVRPNMEWCLKKYDLNIKTKKKAIVLEGLWEGVTSYGACTPGRVYLTKKETRA